MKKSTYKHAAHDQRSWRAQRSPGIAFGFLVFVVSSVAFAAWYLLWVPAESAKSRLLQEDGANRSELQPGATNQAKINDQSKAKPLSEELKEHVVFLSHKIGERNLGRYQRLCRAADYVEKQLSQYGYATDRQTFQVKGLNCHNIIAEKQGLKDADQIVIVGAHYDSARGTPGANDNGSGTAAMLALARALHDDSFGRTVRFVGFTNEEPPYFQNAGEMGSWVYARRCRKQQEKIVGVISLETMGYFSDEPNSQKYPAPLNLLYPSTGNFIGFVSNLKSRPLLTQAVKTFRQHAKISSESAALPESMPGVGWSDHWSFWQEDYPGIMITDTAPFRYPHYHRATDTSDKIDYQRLAQVVEGLKPVIRELALATAGKQAEPSDKE